MNTYDGPLPDTKPKSWIDTAACKDKGDIMWPDPSTLGGVRKEPAVKKAKAVCATCPHAGVNGPCVGIWLTLDELERQHGIWGGYAPGELARLTNPTSTPKPKRDDEVHAFVESRGWVTSEEVAARFDWVGTTHAAYARLRTLVRAGRVDRWAATNAMVIYSRVGIVPPLDAWGEGLRVDLIRRLAANPVPVAHLKVRMARFVEAAAKDPDGLITVVDGVARLTERGQRVAYSRYDRDAGVSSLLHNNKEAING